MQYILEPEKGNIVKLDDYSSLKNIYGTRNHGHGANTYIFYPRHIGISVEKTFKNRQARVYDITYDANGIKLYRR